MKVAVVGATGAVGEEIVSVVGTRQGQLGGVEELALFASARSAGKTLSTTAFGELVIAEFTLDKMAGFDVVFLAVSGGFALEHARAIAELGPLVIDNSSALRNDHDVPLVIPEINGHAALGSRLVANPNCTTAIAAMALWPVHQRFGIKRLVMSTYQAASGSGAEGMAELEGQAHKFVKEEPLEPSVFTYPLLFNVIPHIDTFQDNLYTREEMKVVWETRKIFGDAKMDVSCTAVRIPTLRAHAEAITIETWEPVSPAAATDAIHRARGVEVVDDPAKNLYPMPLTATAKYDVEVGRIRQSLVFGRNGLDLFVCGDQLLRGAALNAVLIAEFLHKGAETAGPKPKRFAPSLAARLHHTTIPASAVLAVAAGTAVSFAFLFLRSGR